MGGPATASRAGADPVAEATTDHMSTANVDNPIDEALRTPRLDRLVAAYFDPEGPFAASTFDTLQPGPPNQITSADLLAVTFLDVRVRPLATRRILGPDAPMIEALLGAVRTNVPLLGGGC